MRQSAKQKEADKLIDEFAAQLLMLNDGKAIPSQWKNRLLKALKPSPVKRGVKRDYVQVAEVVKRLALIGKEIRKPRTKHHNPAVFKDAIAQDLGISRKTVDRIDKDRPEYMRELDRLDRMADLRLRKAYIDGIATAVCQRLKEHDALESKAKEQKMRQRLQQLFPPKE